MEEKSPTSRKKREKWGTPPGGDQSSAFWIAMGVAQLLRPFVTARPIG
jgi:hypothetical protein